MKIMQISIKRKATTALSLVIFALGSLALSPMARAVGVEAPDTALAGGNTADGQLALGGLTTGFYNSAFGIYALLSNGAANFNTGVGAGALLSNTADQSTAVGAGALLSNTTGTVNTATGAFALFSNTTGGSNTATGAEALLHNTLGGGNTATGQQALQANTTGALNTSTGAATLITNTTGSANTADGLNALFSNNGDNNTAVGNGALGANTTGSNNVALGLGAGSGVTTANNVICIGTNVAGNDVNDSCYIGNIFGDTSSGGTAVFVNTNGRLGTTTSSRRFKDSIKPMDQASEALFALKPVTFRYKKEIDPQGIPQFGLVAEDVAAVNPDLVVRDKEGKPHSVRYEQVNAMLLNEFLKEHRTVQELRNEIAALTSTVKQQAAQIQNVSDQIEINKAEPGMVRNDLREAESSTSSQ